MKIRLSLGTAVALGLSRTSCPDLPTTGYLLQGESCSNSCAFCPQAAVSSNGAGRLSRVTWPQYDLDEVVAALARREGVIKRLCLQATSSPGNDQAIDLHLARLKELGLPVCISASVDDLARVEQLLAAGADKVSIALDAATPGLFREIKGRDWEQTLVLLEGAAARFPGRIATHIIIGLGETEEEAARLLARMARQQVTTALFAFTPVSGTPMAGNRPPEMGSWRRLQVANYLLGKVDWRMERGFVYDTGRIISFGLGERLGQLLADGEAFQTSGCPDCNRPYYNERPGTELYNYPRPLTRAERDQALARMGVAG